MKSNIEFAPDYFWNYCTYEEAILYCFQLNIDDKIGWRLPTYDEWLDYDIFSDDDWYEQIDGINFIIPVRDI